MRFNVHLHLDNTPSMSVESNGGYWWINLGDSPSNAVGVFCERAGVSIEQARRAVEAFNAAINEQPLSEAAE